jgi:hypothetical protein
MFMHKLDSPCYHGINALGSSIFIVNRKNNPIKDRWLKTSQRKQKGKGKEGKKMHNP